MYMSLIYEGISGFNDVYLVLNCTLGIARRSLGLTPGYQSGFLFMVFSSLCEIENLGCFLRIKKGVSVWMIWMLDLIGMH